MVEPSATSPEDDSLRQRLVSALRTVRDPEIPVNIYDLGLIYDLRVSEAGVVEVRMTLTTPNCPMAEVIPGQVEAAVRAVEGVREATIDLVWDPPWHPGMMSEAAKLELDYTGQTGPPAAKDRFTSLTVRRDTKRPPA